MFQAPFFVIFASCTKYIMLSNLKKKLRKMWESTCRVQCLMTEYRWVASQGFTLVTAEKSRSWHSPAGWTQSYCHDQDRDFPEQKCKFDKKSPHQGLRQETRITLER